MAAPLYTEINAG